MAVIRVIEPEHYTGLSTDTKPISNNGSTFLSVDTGERWIYHDEMWVIDLTLTRALEGVLS